MHGANVPQGDTIMYTLHLCCACCAHAFADADDSWCALQGMVLRDIKPSNALYSSADRLYRLSDAGLSCVAGSSAYAMDRSRPPGDIVARCSTGRICYNAAELARYNTSHLDVLALGETVFELVAGGRPKEVDIRFMDEYTPDQDVNTSVEAMYDRAVAMLQSGKWLVFVEVYIAPLDAQLAAFLKCILQPREQRATVDQLLQHPYIQRE